LLAVMLIVYFVQVCVAFGESRAQYDLGPAIGMTLLESGEALMVPAAISSRVFEYHEWWRLLTAIFLHAGVFHLLGNGWALLQFGSLLESLCGASVLLLTFFGTGLIASVASAMSFDDHYSLGASGAIFGIVAALILVVGSKRIRAAYALQLQLLLWAVVAISAGFFSMGIDNRAHIGGCLAGLVAGSLINVRERRAPRGPLQKRG